MNGCGATNQEASVLETQASAVVTSSNNSGVVVAPSNGRQLYTVGKLLAEKFENGVSHFKVRWKNYSPAHDTWEPESNLAAVAHLVQEFRQRVAASTTNNAATTSSSSSSSGSGGGGHNSRKRNAASRKWDVVPASQLVASKTKFFDDLEAGRIDIRSNDLYSRVKCRRRANGDSESAASDQEDDEAPAVAVTAAAAAALIADQSTLSINDPDDEDDQAAGKKDPVENDVVGCVDNVDNEEDDAHSNHSDTGSCFAANSVGSSSTVEMDESRPNGQAQPSSAVTALSVVAKDVIANNSASSCDSGCPVTPPKQQQQLQLQQSQPQQQRRKQMQQKSLLTDLLVSAKKQRYSREFHHHQQQQQQQPCQSNCVDTEDDDEEDIVDHQDYEIDEFDDYSNDSASTAAAAAGTACSSQVELLRAHVSAEQSSASAAAASSSIALSATQQRRHRRRAAPLSFVALCQAVERGDWLAVERTLLLRGSFGRTNSLALASMSSAAAFDERLTPERLQQLLCLAAIRGHVGIVDLLLNRAPDFCGGQDLNVNFRSPDPAFGSATPLSLAVECDSLPTVHRLISAGANPDCSFGANSAPIYLAIRNRRPHLVDAICSRAGVNFSVESCDGQTALRYARRTCPRSAEVLQRYVGQVCRSMHDLVIDQLGRFGFEPALMLFAPHFVRPVAENDAEGRTCSTNFQLSADEAAKRGHVLALIHCRQQPRSLLLGAAHSHHQQQQQQPSLSLHCWLADGPCHVTSVSLNGQRQLPLSASGERFLVGLNNCVTGENQLQLTFSRHYRSRQQQASRTTSGGAAAAALIDLRVGVFAMRLTERSRAIVLED